MNEASAVTSKDARTAGLAVAFIQRKAAESTTRAAAARAEIWRTRFFRMIRRRAAGMAGASEPCDAKCVSMAL